MQIDTPAFYNSRKIKQMGTAAVKIQGARSVGVQLTDRNIFVIYNLGDSMMRWTYKSEMRTKVLIKTTLCLNRLSHQFSPDRVNAMLFGNTIEMGYKVLTTAANTPYAITDDSYDHSYFLTNDSAGERLLQLLCNSEMHERMNALLRAGLHPCNPNFPIENDAMTPDGSPVLFAHTIDLPRLKRFGRALDIRGTRGVLICFDYQNDVLERYFSERVIFQSISFTKWERDFFA